MTREALLARMAPCSLLCHTCAAYRYGIISRLSRELSHYLEGLSDFYKLNQPQGEASSLERYRHFEEELGRYGEGHCDGCRTGNHNGCSIKTCFIPQCVKEHHVDYCGECPCFPCSRVTDAVFQEPVLSQWREGNRAIQKLGAQQAYERKKREPHYRAYHQLFSE